MLDDSSRLGLDAESAGCAPVPPFLVRRSARAKHVRLTVTARDGLVVVVPQRWRGDASAIVEQKSAWARSALDRVAERRSQLLAGAEALLPSRVDLPGIDVHICVEYRATRATSVSARVTHGALVVSGAVGDADACLAALRRWLTRVAASSLPTRVSQLAALHQSHPSSVRVGSARTRWGSCSGRRVVMLNRNAVFLPPSLLDSLVLHELAHLSVMDHSARFWKALEGMDPLAHEHRAQLKLAGHAVPAWADA